MQGDSLFMETISNSAVQHFVAASQFVTCHSRFKNLKCNRRFSPLLLLSNPVTSDTLDLGTVLTTRFTAQKTQVSVRVEGENRRTSFIYRPWT